MEKGSAEWVRRDSDPVGSLWSGGGERRRENLLGGFESVNSFSHSWFDWFLVRLL